jgi:NAD(P)-dependent dehydrogenase (short-subunit alcohol dehydrogenase family)
MRQKEAGIILTGGEEPLEIRDRIALVTGGAHRVGKAIALALAREGAHVAITYHTSAEQANQTAAEIEACSVGALAVSCDQSDPAQVVAVFDALKARWERLDILINSAAIMQQKPFLDITPEDWDATLDINLKGPFLFSQHAGRMMVTHAQAGGVIINIADEAGLSPWPRYVHHSVSKAGVIMLTKATALALAPHVRVNAIAPGPVLKPQGWTEERWDTLRLDTPLDRLGSPQDVVDAVLYLIRAEFVTGQVLVVDGGREL